MKNKPQYEVTKEGDGFVATGEGLIGMGKTPEQALARLEFEIKEFKALYKDVLGKEGVEILENNHS